MSILQPTLPAELRPVDDSSFDIGRRKRLSIRRYTIAFARCPDPVDLGPRESRVRKPQVLFERRALFPEIALLILFTRAGWDGVWADPVRRKFFDKMPNQSKGISLDGYASRALARIAANNGQSRSGCWDLILWRGRHIVFVSLKGASKGEKVSQVELDWLDACLKSGLALNQFLIVEWDYRKLIVRRKR